ncbi:MAG: hypothetical protein RJB66_784 [Pseudomonadota bacterium]|jgi:hypothetical protein
MKNKLRSLPIIFTAIPLIFLCVNLQAGSKEESLLFEHFKHKACDEIRSYDAIFEKFAKHVSFEPLYKSIEPRFDLSETCLARKTISSIQKLSDDLKVACLKRAQLPKIYQNKDLQILSCQHVSEKVNLLRDAYASVGVHCRHQTSVANTQSTDPNENNNSGHNQ